MHLREGDYEKAHTDFFEVCLRKLKTSCVCVTVSQQMSLFYVIKSSLLNS